jgi:hypothetical protein
MRSCFYVAGVVKELAGRVVLPGVAGVSTGRSRELPHFRDPLDLANAEAGCMRSEFVHGPLYGSLRI